MAEALDIKKNRIILISYKLLSTLSSPLYVISLRVRKIYKEGGIYSVFIYRRVQLFYRGQGGQVNFAVRLDKKSERDKNVKQNSKRGNYVFKNQKISRN